MSGSLQRTLLTLAVLSCATAVHPVVAGAPAAMTRETPLVRAVRQCRKSVVNIHTERLASDEKETRFFSQKSRKVTGMGTGIVVDERGYVVTNYHVIQDVDKLLVTLDGGATYDARPISFDRRQDLAIIRIESREPLTVMPMGTSTDLMLAETVFAVGNAYGYEHTITSGIISALHRDVEVDETQSYQNLIQTDASINPGNSGGPLLNLDGEVIGINVAIRQGAQRIGFAIPIDDARRTIARLMSVERLNGLPHGLTTTDVKQPGNHQLLVEKVSPGSSSERSGLRSGDIICKVREVTVQDGTDLERSLLDLPAGQVVEIILRRDGRDQTVKYVVGHGRSTGTAISASAGPINAGTDSPTAPQTAARRPVTEPLTAGAAGAATSSSPATTATATADPIVSKAWDLLGLRLAELDERDRSQIRGRYEGGMKITSVRSGSLAARHGMKSGDVLVGLDGYQTLGPDNLRFILSDERIVGMTAVSFQLVRTGLSQPLQGSLDFRAARR